jgi:prephenate dehydrogenase
VPGIRRLCCTRNAAAREWALAEHAADFASDDPAEVIPQADVTFLSLPLPVIVRYLTEYAHLWRPGTVVTDMGSVKGAILSVAEHTVVPRGVVFVGGHPMAGTEYSGHVHAFPTMFRGADVFLCPASNASDAHVEIVAGFWRAVKTNVIRIDPKEHDDLVAHTSHVQHIVASALALTILGSEDPREKMLRDAGCAGGFRDTSRIASSNPVMWREIIEFNTPAILTALDNFQKKLDVLRGEIASGDYDAFQREFARGKELRDAWLVKHMRNK